MRMSFRLGSKRATGELVKTNDKTVLVKMPNGKVIKRHIEKHAVREED